MWALLRAMAVVLAASVVAAPGMAAMVTLSGEVTYRERIALPSGASLRLRLVDLTDTGAPPKVDVRAPIGSPGQVPLSFALNFDDLAVVRTNEHGLIAEILADNEVWFRNEEPYRLDPFVPEAPVVVITTFAGRIAASGQEAAAPQSAASQIVGITWRAIAIGGEPTLSDVDSTLLIEPDRRVGGRGGCNNYFAQASIAGSSLRFSPAASTRMACLSDAANAQETAFFAALETVRFWRLTSDGLELFGVNENEVLRFVAVTR